MPNKKTIQERFELFHANNPEVYVELCKLARTAQQRGFRKYGIGALWEILRWNYDVGGEDDTSVYKLCDNYRSRYVRLIQAAEPDLQNFFRTRPLRSA